MHAIGMEHALGFVISKSFAHFVEDGLRLGAIRAHAWNGRGRRSDARRQSGKQGSGVGRRGGIKFEKRHSAGWRTGNAR